MAGSLLMSEDGFEIHEAEWTPEKVRRVWAYFANTADADRKYFSSHSGDAILDFIKGKLDLTGRSVLDYGCGPGYLSERLARRGIRVTSLEFSEESCRKVQQRCASYSSFGGVVHARRIPTPLPDSSVDVVLFIEVIEHLLPHEVEPTLGDIHRILKPDGRVVITTPHAEDLDLIKTACPDCGCVFHPWQHVASFTSDKLARLMAPYFTTLLCETTTFGMSFTGKLIHTVRGALFGAASLPADPHLAFIGKKHS